MNTKFEQWLEKVNQTRKEYWEKNFNYREYLPLTYTKGRKFIKITEEGRVWGFISMVDGQHKGETIHSGDLMKPASWQSPSKHSRGNIFEGTDKWNFYGVNYYNF